MMWYGIELIAVSLYSIHDTDGSLSDTRDDPTNDPIQDAQVHSAVLTISVFMI